MRDGPAVATQGAPTALVAIPPAAADRRADGGAGRSLLPYRARPTPAEQLLARRYFNHLEPGPAQ